MKKYIKYLPFFALLLLLVPTLAMAQCPVCTIAAGTGLIIFRKLGIDDSITGLWIGGLLMSTTLWTVNWLQSKKIIFFGRNFLVAIIYYASVLIPFYLKNIISKNILGSHYQTLWGIDKLILGIILGSIALLVATIIYGILKAKNGGHAHFPYEKVALPVGSLVVLSVIFYFITK